MNLNRQRHTILTLVLLIIINLLVYFLETTLVTDEMLYESMITRFDHGTVMEQLQQLNKAGFVLFKYVGVVVLTVLKPVVITLILMSGFFAFNIKISFVEIFQVVLLPCFIFIIPDVLKVTWFILIQTDYQLADLNNFPRFSLPELFAAFEWTTGEDLKRLLKPINVVNLVFCWVLAKRLLEIKQDEKKVFKLVFISFFSVLLVFRLAVHFVATFFKP
ncbi:MAG: hypothetical protein L6Q51_02400 [Cyclobacteriaceae bacterium]|nr:hypothetical protein [Cyclobacteriaceae bacterium]